ncbi:hypothetical protein QQF64_000479 [Cirrhinus molitorella]|uniref:Adhesion G protein-coupled receptor E3-like n=1 Tax=Cirrhinus molitorella TaxID=172907 RepID=A0ABR3NYM3_9TELE
MNIVLHLTALQLMIILSNVVIDKSQGHWYCTPLVNSSSCTNSSSYVDCLGQNVSCKAYSCDSQSTSCTCKIGSYHCSNYSYEASPDVCTCKENTCRCLKDMIDNPGSIAGETTENVVNLIEQIANMTGLMSTEAAENYLKIVDDTQVKVVTSVNAEDKSKLVSYGNTYLNAFENLVSALVTPTANYTLQNINLDKTEVRVLVVGTNASEKQIPSVSTERAQMDINLYEIAKSNPSGFASVGFMSYKEMGNFLKPDFFNASNSAIKTMMSNVISATLYTDTNTKSILIEPVNFTLKHIAEIKPSGSLSCVYWNISEWTVDGCSVLKTNSSHTVCSCVHLSTFALIMQTNLPSVEDPLMELLNLVCVIVGLVFFSLALLTFALCQWSPGVNNVARINICISLLLAHLLLLLTQQFLNVIRPQQVLCTVISGLLHFLFLSAFVWMFTEAVMLFICVKNLSQISSKKKEVLNSGFMCVIGYLVALVVVCVSVGLFPEGYGSEQCWIKQDKGFIWSFLGPVCVILALNTILFIKIVITLNSTLRKLNAEVSQMKQTKIMVFKTLAQCVILGCPWILGFFTNDSDVLKILFLILNSQQGTFIFLIYCVLNNEIRQQYRNFFRCLRFGCNKKLKK